MRNLRHSVKSWIPNWLADRAVFRVGFAIVFTLALVADCFVEALSEALAMAFPGKGDASALGLDGQSRGLIQGLAQSNPSFATLLQSWLDIWTDAGSAETLATLIQTYLGNNLVVRIVDRQGNFVTVNADGSITKVFDFHWNWDNDASTYIKWDGTADDHSFWWSDIWIIIYVTDGRWGSGYTSLTDPAWLAAWSNSTVGIDLFAPPNVVTDIRALVSSFKGAHTYVEAIVLTNDATAFVPGALGGQPNGTWFNYGQINATIYEPARPITTTGGGWVRFWIPNNGG